MVDSRTVNDVSGWIKPTKFFVSLALYFATLAWYFGYLPNGAAQLRGSFRDLGGDHRRGARDDLDGRGRDQRRAVALQPRERVWETAYSVAGVGAVTLMIAVLVQGVQLARDRVVRIAPAFRLSLVIGAILSCAATVFIAMTLASGDGHWIGGVRSDAGGLPLLGWSRTGGDLRVAHFWALHAHQFIPLAGWLVVRTRMRGKRSAVLAFAAAYIGLIAFTFMQALQEQPFIP